MKKFIFSILIILVLLSVSCNKENPANPDELYSNAPLSVRLAHYHYNDPFYSIQFYPNGKFIEKHSISNFDTKDSIVQLYERLGNYKLESNLLKMSSLKVTIDTQRFTGISIIWSDREVYIENNVLSFKPVTVLEGKNNKTELWDLWKTIRWVYHYDSYSKIEYNGREEYFYEFTKDDPKVKFGWNYLDGQPRPSKEHICNFKYNHPDLYLEETSIEYTVEFKNNKMYWYNKPLLEKQNHKNITTHPLAPEVVSYQFAK